MSEEAVVLFLVFFQIIIVCCCIYAVKVYCGPCRILRIIIRKFFNDPEEREQTQAQNPTQAATPVYQQTAPLFPSYQPPPYPILPVTPLYPHNIGFVFTSPSPQKLEVSSKMLINPADEQQKDAPTK